MTDYRLSKLVGETDYGLAVTPLGRGFMGSKQYPSLPAQAQALCLRRWTHVQCQNSGRLSSCPADVYLSGEEWKVMMPHAIPVPQLRSCVSD